MHWCILMKKPEAVVYDNILFSNIIFLEIWFCVNIYFSCLFFHIHVLSVLFTRHCNHCHHLLPTPTGNSQGSFSNITAAQYCKDLLKCYVLSNLCPFILVFIMAPQMIFNNTFNTCSCLPRPSGKISNPNFYPFFDVVFLFLSETYKEGIWG